MKRQWAVLIPMQPAWDQDRVCNFFDDADSANAEAQHLATGWQRPIVVAKIVNTFEPQPEEETP